MNKFIRWYNQNREVFITGVIVCALIIIIIHVLNGIAAEDNKRKKNELSNRNSSTNSTTISEIDTSAITGEKMTETQAKQNSDVIKTFVNYCNNKEMEKAYNMLSDECKETIYPDISTFKKNYYDTIFTIYRMYNLENWYNSRTSSTYYIAYIEDVLATGNTNSANNRGDYITVVNDDNGYKINISSYIGRKKINKSESKNKVEVTINYADMYMDYTIYNISVKNNTENTICIDTKEDINTMYLYDSNGIHYTSFLNEIAGQRLVVYKLMTQNINIKFNKIYNSRTIKGIKMTDVVLNYENYNSGVQAKQVISMDIKI